MHGAEIWLSEAFGLLSSAVSMGRADAQCHSAGAWVTLPWGSPESVPSVVGCSPRRKSGKLKPGAGP